MEVIIFLVLVAIIAALAARFLLSVVTVRDYQRGLHYRGGKLVGLLSTGTHYAIKPMSEIQVLDVRPALLTVPGQEILHVRRRRPEDQPDGPLCRVRPGRGDTNDQSWLAALYAALHAGLRDAIAGRTADDVLATRSEIGPLIAAAVASDIARIGVELLTWTSAT